MTLRHLVVASFVHALVAACGPSSAEPVAPDPDQQTFEQAMELICDVDRRAGLSEEEDPLGIGAARLDWLNARLENPDAIELWTLVRVKSLAEQARSLRAAADRAGARGCALADSLEASDPDAS